MNQKLAKKIRKFAKSQGFPEKNVKRVLMSMNRINREKAVREIIEIGSSVEQNPV